MLSHNEIFYSALDSDDDLEMNRGRNVVAPLRNPSDPNPDDIYTLQRQIQESKTVLENEIYPITRRKQKYYLNRYGVLSIVVGWNMFLWSNEKDIEFSGIGIGLQGILLPLCLAYFTHLSLPFHKVPCIKYPRLIDLLLPTEKHKIITSMRDAHFYFPSIPTVNREEDGAAVLRKLNIAIKEIDQEMKVNAKKRGKEVLSVFKKVGVFSRNYGPVQKTILEYMISDESIVKSLAVPPPKKASL